MASSNVIASRSPPNSDLPRQSSTSPLNLHSDQTRGFSMNMDEILRNIYADPTFFAVDNTGLPAGDGGIRNGTEIKSADEVWRDIVGGGAAIGGSGGEPAMTLEDFLAKAGAVNEEDVRVPAVVTMPPPPPPTVGAFGIETVMMNSVAGVPATQFTAAQNVLGVDFGGGIPASSGGGRGKRRVAVEEPPLDKATQQKQRRMIKNRESAARSRERKQAYNVELEALVTQLEEDNARLLREEVELSKERHKQIPRSFVANKGFQRTDRNFSQGNLWSIRNNGCITNTPKGTMLMENLIPVVEKETHRRFLAMEQLNPVEEKKQRPQNVLRRTRSL